MTEYRAIFLQVKLPIQQRWLVLSVDPIGKKDKWWDFLGKSLGPTSQPAPNCQWPQFLEPEIIFKIFDPLQFCQFIRIFDLISFQKPLEDCLRWWREGGWLGVRLFYGSIVGGWGFSMVASVSKSAGMSQGSPPSSPSQGWPGFQETVNNSVDDEIICCWNHSPMSHYCHCCLFKI